MRVCDVLSIEETQEKTIHLAQFNENHSDVHMQIHMLCYNITEDIK